MTLAFTRMGLNGIAVGECGAQRLQALMRTFRVLSLAADNEDRELINHGVRASPIAYRVAGYGERTCRWSRLRRADCCSRPSDDAGVGLWVGPAQEHIVARTQACRTSIIRVEVQFKLIVGRYPHQDIAK